MLFLFSSLSLSLLLLIQLLPSLPSSSFLYPLAQEFFHLYKKDHDQTHPSDLHTLEMLRGKDQVAECELAMTFRTQRYNVPLSSVALQLLLAFLRDSGHAALLRIVNDRFNFRIVEGMTDESSSPSGPSATTGTSTSTDGSSAGTLLGIIGGTPGEVEETNRTPLHLGPRGPEAGVAEALTHELLQGSSSKGGEDGKGKKKEKTNEDGDGDARMGEAEGDEDSAMTSGTGVKKDKDTSSSSSSAAPSTTTTSPHVEGLVKKVNEMDFARRKAMDVPLDEDIPMPTV